MSDYYNIIDSAEKRAREEGLLQGRLEGIEQGIEQGIRWLTDSWAIFMPYALGISWIH